MRNLNKFAGWVLCVASVLMLADLGKLDLLVVLLPVSALLSVGIAGVTRGNGNADRRRKKGLA